MQGCCPIKRFGGIALLAVLLGSPSSAEASTFEFTPVADTYVDASAPTVSYGNAFGFWADASPRRESFVRFKVSGLGGRAITRVRLRMRARDDSVSGGRVFALAPSGWDETSTFENRPAVAGSPLATFGAVVSDATYELDLGLAVQGDGLYAFAIDSASSDGARWGSRESTGAPRLLVDAQETGQPIDGLSEVADGATGSSSPTYTASNHRVAETSGGRLLAVHGRHATGVAVKWRDPESNWRSATIGSNTNGFLLEGTGTGDWPASIVVGRDAGGAEHAWVIWSRVSYSSAQPVQMLRLSDLDSPLGPTIGPATTVDAPPGGAYRADIGLEQGADGRNRGVLLWSRKLATDAYEVVSASIDDLSALQPVVSPPTVLVRSSTYSRYGTLEATSRGMRAAVRDASGYLRVFTHDAQPDVAGWSSVAGTDFVTGNPSAVGLNSGELLVAHAGATSNAEVRVQRFSANGQPLPVELRLAGYRQPTIGSDGARAWLVMVRAADGFVVSRELDPGTGWSTTDRVEVGQEGGGNYADPNMLRRVGTNLRFLVRGPSTSTTSTSSVLSIQRPV